MYIFRHARPRNGVPVALHSRQLQLTRLKVEAEDLVGRGQPLALSPTFSPDSPRTGVHAEIHFPCRIKKSSP